MQSKQKDGDLDFDKVVKNLKCMRGIDEDFIPPFKYFQFKKSYIKGFDGEHIMLCFQDISQNIL
jgi:hypothetical protein